MPAPTLPLVLAGVLQTQDATAPPPQPPARPAVDVAPARAAPKSESRWFVRVSPIAALYNSKATISAFGSPIPGATAHAKYNVTLSFDVGYDVTDRFALMFMGGVPPKLSVTGEGAAAQFGRLGSAIYGPVLLTGVYRLPEWRGLRPYMGAGPVYAIILKNEDGAVTDLKVRNNWGVALQAGVEHRLTDRLEMFVDYKRVWLSVNATGGLEGVPVRAHVTLDPDLVSAGLKFHFR